MNPQNNTDCEDSVEVRIIKLFTVTFSRVQNQDECCFTSTETIRTIKDGMPRTVTSTFTQLLSSEASSRSVLLYVHIDHKDYYGRGQGLSRSVLLYVHTKLLSSAFSYVAEPVYIPLAFSTEKPHHSVVHF